MPGLIPFTEEQSRQVIDVEQAFQALRATQHEFAHGYEGSYAAIMKWGKRCGREYLIRRLRRTDRSLGPRSPETEALKDSYMTARRRLRERMRRQMKRLKEMTRINRALRLNRVPGIAAKVLRALEGDDLLGRHVHVVGTNAIYLYEMLSGDFVEGRLVATRDFDLLLDARRSLRLLSADVRQAGILGALRTADESFTARRGEYRAVNADGYMVDVIGPETFRGRPKQQARDRISDDDLVAAPIEGLEWLLVSPKIQGMAIGHDGMPVWMSCIDPRAYALHKAWLSQNETRDPRKKRRDLEQALVVAEMAKSMGLSYKDRALSALPARLRGMEDLLRRPRSS